MNNLYIVFIFITIASFGQEPIHTYYNIDDGLPSNEIYHALQDTEGFMWFATDNGVSRFNGYEFENFDLNDGLPDNVIFYMYEDFKNRIWFVSYSCQLSYFFEDSIYQYQYNNLISDTLGNKTRIFNTSFYVDSLETIFFGTYGQGIFSIDKKGNIENTIEEGMVQINIKNNEVLTASNSHCDSSNFLIKKGNESFYFDGNYSKSARDRHISLLTKGNQLLYSNGDYVYNIVNNTVSDVHEFDRISWLGKDVNSNLWIAKFNNGVNCYKNLDINSLSRSYLEGKTITKVCVSGDNSYWITTLYGLYHFPDIRINTISSSKLQKEKVNRIEAGEKGEVWFATEKASIYKFSNGEVYSFLDTKPSSIQTLDYNKKTKRLYFSGSEVFGYIQNDNRIDNRKILYKFKDTHRDFAYVKQLYRINDTLFGFIGFGVGEIDLKKNSQYKISSGTIIQNTRPLSIYYDNNQVLYIGTKKGLWVYTNNEFREIEEDNPLLQVKIVDLSKDTEGNLWLAAKGNGIVIKTKTSTLQITEKEGLSSDAVNTLFIDSNIVWVGTMYGLNKITIEDIEKKQFKIERIYKYHGLASNVINDVVVNNGQVYVGTDGGLSYFKISDFTFNQKMAHVYLTNISISEKDTVLLSAYNLDYSQNTISIEYVGLNYRNSNETKYKYRLLGAEKDWVETKNRIVRYPSLNPGTYEFEVIAMNENGIWGEEPASIIFTINPPYWERWWFILLIISFLIGITLSILLTIYNIKLNELKKRNEIIASLYNYKQQALSKHINPHFIFNSLNSIQNYILKNDRVLSSEYLNKFSNLIRKILVNSQSSTIFIKDEVESLELYLELESNRFKNKFSYTISVSHEGIYNYKIPPLLIQPFAENAIWHGLMHMKEKGCIKILLEEKNNFIYCSIDDNGIGREKANEFNDKKRESYGTSITEKRLETINLLHNSEMSIEYIDKKENNQALGTTVIMRFPIIK